MKISDEVKKLEETNRQLTIGLQKGIEEIKQFLDAWADPANLMPQSRDAAVRGLKTFLSFVEPFNSNSP